MTVRRTALLIHCSAEQARTIRERASGARRTISGYVLNIVLRAVRFEESFLGQRSRSGRTGMILPKAMRPAGTRTALLIRCSVEEGKRIRARAKDRDTTISAFVLFSLQRSWNVTEGLPKLPPREIPKPER